MILKKVGPTFSSFSMLSFSLCGGENKRTQLVKLIRIVKEVFNWVSIAFRGWREIMVLLIIPLFQFNDYSKGNVFSVIPEKPRPLLHYSTAKISVILFHYPSSATDALVLLDCAPWLARKTRATRLTNEDWSLAFSRAWRRLQVFASSSDWFCFVFFGCDCIGQSDYFGLGFTTLSSKTLYNATNYCN